MRGSEFGVLQSNLVCDALVLPSVMLSFDIRILST